MQKRFEEKLEALREENGEIKAQLDSKKNDVEMEKSPEKSEEEEKRHRRSQKEKDQITREHAKKPRSRRRTERARFLTP